MDSTEGNPYLFTGRRWEPEVGLYQYRHRYYKPDWGRFVQRDPLGYVDGMGLHSYVENVPLTKTDAFGEVSSVLDPRGGAVAASVMLEIQGAASLGAQIALLVSGGYSIAKIAQALGIPESVVRRHLRDNDRSSFRLPEDGSPPLMDRPAVPRSIPRLTRPQNPHRVPRNQPRIDPAPTIDLMPPLPIDVPFDPWREPDDCCRCICMKLDGRGEKHGPYKFGTMSSIECISYPSTNDGRKLNYFECWCAK